MESLVKDMNQLITLSMSYRRNFEDSKYMKMVIKTLLIDDREEKNSSRTQ